MNAFFICAAALGTFNTSLHFFVGGKTIARPLLDATELSDRVRYVQYFCWHIATLALGFQAVLFGVAAGVPGFSSFAMIGTAMAASVGLLGLVLPLALKVSYRIMPQGWLFVPVAALGAVGLFT